MRWKLSAPWAAGSPVSAKMPHADAALDRALAQVADAHPDRVAGWLRNEPGHWGFFAGQAVLAIRQLVGRRLAEPERRFVWHQMWLVLQEKRRESELGDRVSGAICDDAA